MSQVTEQLADERVPADEAEDLEAINQISLEILDTARRPVRRGQHPKHHGCVRAEFVVGPDVPDDLKVGIFREAKTYQATVRFSNGAQQDDTRPDIHGMAVKVLGVKGPRALEKDDGEAHDFVLIDTEVFFAPDAKTVLEFMKARVAAAKDPEAMKKFAAKDPNTAARVMAALKKMPPPLAAHGPVLEHCALQVGRPGREVHRAAGGWERPQGRQALRGGLPPHGDGRSPDHREEGRRIRAVPDPPDGCHEDAG